MSLDRLIDAVSTDAQPGAAGGFVMADELANQIVMSFSIPLGSWEGDPTFGHRFDELSREIDTVETRGRLADFAKQAVQWLVDLGSLSEVDVIVQSAGPGEVAFQALCYQPGSSSPVGGVGIQFVSVGGG